MRTDWDMKAPVRKGSRNFGRSKFIVEGRLVGGRMRGDQGDRFVTSYLELSRQPASVVRVEHPLCQLFKGTKDGILSLA